MKYRANAKVNLVLDIIGKRPDGYHDLAMVMVPLEFHDLLDIEIFDEMVFETNASFLSPEKNLVVNTIEVMREKYKFTENFRIYLKKCIPTQAGLGGGSADAAATIHLVDRLLKLKMTNLEKEEIAEQVGSDIKFCLYNKISLVEGTGEKVSSIDTKSAFYLLLVKPKRGISTKRAYAEISNFEIKHYAVENMVSALKQDDYEKIIESLGNSFEEIGIHLVNDIQDIKTELIEFGFDGALMTGSGSTVFGITKDKDILIRGVEFFKKKYPFVWATKIKES